MLQSIIENSKKNDVINKKSTEIDLNKAKDVRSKIHPKTKIKGRHKKKL
jgi:hypothetical protein